MRSSHIVRAVLYLELVVFAAIILGILGLSLNSSHLVLASSLPQEEPTPQPTDVPPPPVVEEPAPPPPPPAVEQPAPPPPPPPPAPESAAPEPAAPAPQVNEPAPQVVEPAPQVAEPAPQVVEPAPQAQDGEPAPQVGEPVLQGDEPAPQAGSEPAPQTSEPAPQAQDGEPAPQVVEPTPQAQDGEPAPQIDDSDTLLAAVTVPQVDEPAAQMDGSDTLLAAVTAPQVIQPAPQSEDSGVPLAVEPAAQTDETASQSGEPAPQIESPAPQTLALAALELPAAPLEVVNELPAELAGVEAALGDGDLPQVVEALSQADVTLVDSSGESVPLATDEAAQMLASQSLLFIPNEGQVDAEAKFYVRSLGGTLFFTQNELVLSLSDAVLRTQFANANAAAEIMGDEQLSGVVNYLVGSDAQDWHTDIPTYSGITYTNLFNGVDVKYEDAGGTIKSTYTVAAGADPYQILWNYAGADSLQVDEASGDLMVTVNGAGAGQVNTFVEKAPVSWQDINGQRVFVHSTYTVNADGQVGYALGDYDAKYALTIDPITLGYSTYLGGAGDDIGTDVTVDSSGNSYIVGSTTSAAYPTSGAYQGANAGGTDAFVTKVNSSGGLVYSTYIGGAGTDTGYDIAVDGSGNAFITGTTDSANYPTAAAAQGALGGGTDVFVTKLNASGAGVTYSTYLGGAGNDEGNGIALDGSSNAYITGSTTDNFVTTGGAYQVVNAGGTDAFVSKFTSAGALSYSTLVGGAGTDIGNDIAVDGSGYAYITGSTTSAAYPTVSAYQGALGGATDAFVTKVNQTGSGLTYSTYLGGAGTDIGYGIAVNSSNIAAVAGSTTGSFTTIAGSYDTTYNGGATDAFYSRYNASGTLTQSTYLGGSGDDVAYDITTTAANTAYLTGSTTSTDFPISEGYQSSNAGFKDAFVTVFNSDSTLSYSTYLGGTMDDIGYGIAVNGGVVYLAGATQSNNFPMSSAYDSSSNGGWDVFAARLDYTLPSSSSSTTTTTTDEDEDYTTYYPWWWPYYYPNWWLADQGYIPVGWWEAQTLSYYTGIYATIPVNAAPWGSVGRIYPVDINSVPPFNSDIQGIGPAMALSVVGPYGNDIYNLSNPATLSFRIPDDLSIPAGWTLAAAYWDPYLGGWLTLPVTVSGQYAYTSATRTGTYALVLMKSSHGYNIPSVWGGSTTSGNSSSGTSVVSTRTATLSSVSTTALKLTETSGGVATETVRLDVAAASAPSGSKATLSQITADDLVAQPDSNVALVGVPLRFKLSSSSGKALATLNQAAALRILLPDDFTLAAGKMLALQYYDKDSGRWFTLPVSVQDKYAYANISLPGDYTLVAITKPVFVDLLGSGASPAQKVAVLDPSNTNSFRIYQSQTGGTAAEVARLEFPAGAAPMGSKVTITQTLESALPAALASGSDFAGQALNLAAADSSGAALDQFNKPAAVRFSLAADFELPSGQKLAVQYYDSERGKWVILPSSVQDNYVFASVSTPGTYALTFVSE